MNGSAATSNSYLGTEKISKLIIKLALPTVTAQIVNMLYNLVDRIYIGNIDIIGEKALTGLGVCQPIILFIAAFSALICYGGDIAVGSMTILSSVNMFLMLPLQGLVQGAQPVVSYNFGAGNAGRVKNAFFVLLKISVVYSFVMWASVMLFPGFFARLFGDNPALIEYTKGSARIFFAVSVLMGVQIACQQTFVAIGNAKSSLFLAALRKLILLIPLIYILPVFFADKTFAVFLAEPVADFIAVCTTSLMFFVQFRKTLKNMDSHNHVENGVK